MNSIADALIFFGPLSITLASYTVSRIDEFIARSTVNDLCRTKLTSDQFIKLTEKPSWRSMQRREKSFLGTIMPKGFMMVAGSYYGTILSFMATSVIEHRIQMQLEDRAFIGAIAGGIIAYNIKERLDRSILDPFQLMNERGIVDFNGTPVQALLISPICIEANAIQSATAKQEEKMEFSTSGSVNTAASEYILSERVRLEGVIFESSLLSAANSIDVAFTSMNVESTLAKAGGCAAVIGATWLTIRESIEGKCNTFVECFSDGVNRAATATGRLPSMLFQNDECQKNPSYKKCGLTIL